MNSEEKIRLQNFAIDIREKIIYQMSSLGSGHLGGNLSIAEIVAVLYGSEMKYDPADPKSDERDILICSKGHAGPCLYSALAMKGFVPMERLDTLNRGGTELPSHCDRLHVPGIEMTTGSLGQGFSAACGMALASKLDGNPRTVYCIIGDGESQEGQIWEAVLFAKHQQLDNLILFVDYNKAQLDGLTKDICDMGDYVDKFHAFGWHTAEIDGHDVEAIKTAVDAAKADKTGLPHVIVCNTIKGYGVSFTKPESCHHVNFTPELTEQCMRELEASRPTA